MNPNLHCDPNKYAPTMCAYCKLWIDDMIRTQEGRRGYCVAVQSITYRTDWCHKPEEIEMHNEMMKKYRVQGERRCKQTISSQN